MIGYVHSIETFGTVDGPGIRLVVFLKGCIFRCLYCHNPDTWDRSGSKEMKVSEIIDIFERNRSFYKTGGITVSGGEPILQIDFLIELFRECKRENIHTCLDTSGSVFDKEKLDILLPLCDLVMLDLKHIDAEKHTNLCGKDNSVVFKFAEYLNEKKVNTWIRHVVVPGINDDYESLYALGNYIGTLKNVSGLDVLPYHDMGKTKYHNLNIPYALEDTLPLAKEKAFEARNIILQGMKKSSF